MSLKTNYDPFAMPNSPSREWTFGVFIYQNLPSISLIVSANARFISIIYEFGVYRHNIRMNVNGQADDRVWRSGKLLSQENTVTEPNYANPTGSANKPPYVKSHFVAGAANGILGIGITREARFPDVYIKVAVYEGLFCFQVVQEQINTNILTVTVAPSTLEVDVVGSDMGQLISEGQLTRTTPPPVVAKVEATATAQTTLATTKSEARVEISRSRAWYKSDYGIGAKRSDLYFMDFEIKRLDAPEAGYKILHPHPRKEGQVVPRFVLDAEIEKPTIRGGTVSSSCPNCNALCSSPNEQNMYFKCAACHTSWWQKR